MDQGVIRATKAFYRTSVVRMYIDALEKGKPAPNISVLDAMTILTGAWKKVTTETIENCFKKAGICEEAQMNAVHDIKALTEEIESLRQNFPETVTEDVTSEDVVSTDDRLVTSRINKF
ncbi:predicted protein [Nematostella vectensis]|uniref:DDE-1 domain-containing protein n=1 Tax=Nematostella vectensis TaxID=45351 RepID=A7S5N7_NEMVE|nr:predicted protein [Nematostella vectensis]|eukprot:XP_001633106.1 predicted protein [Nematostella vectensis]